jgi:hypothetical protein
MTVLHCNSATLRRLGFAAAAFGLLALPAPALATPLDKDACAKLAQDMQNMKMLEVDKLMENGATWAASHLSAADMSLVRQYIDLDEQLKFRCSAPSSLVHLKHLDEEDEETGAAKQPDTAETEAKKDQAGDGQEEDASPPPPEKHKAAKAPAKKSPPPQAASAH